MRAADYQEYVLANGTIPEAVVRSGVYAQYDGVPRSVVFRGSADLSKMRVRTNDTVTVSYIFSIVSKGCGAVMSFEIKGGAAKGEKFVESVKLFKHVANIGDVRSLLIHPASTTHRQLTDEQLLEAGVPQDLIRISVGLEDIEDILWDLDQALTIATGQVR